MFDEVEENGDYDRFRSEGVEDIYRQEVHFEPFFAIREATNEDFYDEKGMRFCEVRIVNYVKKKDFSDIVCECTNIFS